MEPKAKPKENLHLFIYSQCQPGFATTVASSGPYKNILHSKNTTYKNDPKFVVDIQKKINSHLPSVNKGTKELFKQRQDYIDQILQVYRQAFKNLLENVTTFKPLLVKIKDAYEDALTIRERQIELNDNLLNVIWTSNEENESIQAIEKLTNDNEVLRRQLKASQEQNEKLTGKVEQLEKETFVINLALSSERDARYALFHENHRLKSELQNLPKNPDKNKDPVVLSLALEQYKKSLSKAIQDLNTMSEDYSDAIPKKEYELLESDHIVLMRDFNETISQLKEITEKYETLSKEYSSLKDEAVDLRDRCTDLEQVGTPRPQWDICADFIGGGSSRWKELTKGLSSRDQLHVILRELGPIAQSLNLEYFEGLGLDPVVPSYLQYEGQVRNLRLSRRELSILINDIWAAKTIHEGEISMQDFLSKYFSERYQQASIRAEWAYNLCSGCEQMLDDQQIKLFWGVLNGALCQDIYYAHKSQWSRFKDNVLKFANGVKNTVSMEDLEKSAKTSFPIKSEVEIKNILEVARRQLKIKSVASEVDLDKLFIENEEGFERTDLAKELFRQMQISQEKYTREIIVQLGGKKNPNKLISVENLKRAFVIVDPHINHIVMESNIRWAFSDKTSNLTMIYPIPLKVLAAKLSSGNIQRVGPRTKGK